jgi:hypothetical protein
MDIHVPIGINDPYVNRLHGVLVCDGREWWVRTLNHDLIQALLRSTTLMPSDLHLLRENPGETHD